MARTKNVYLTSEEIYDEWKQWKETCIISERMGRQMLTLANRVMTSHHFNGYPQYMKDDMVQEGVIKIIKNLHNMKDEYKSSFFSYWTRCVWTSSIVYLKKHYKDVNFKRKLIIEKLEQVNLDGRYSDAQFIKMLKDELAQYENDEKEEDDDLKIE